MNIAMALDVYRNDLSDRLMNMAMPLDEYRNGQPLDEYRVDLFNFRLMNIALKVRLMIIALKVRLMNIALTYFSVLLMIIALTSIVSGLELKQPPQLILLSPR